MRKELEHYYIGESYGGQQEWFTEPWMKIGGCGAVTACDICIYLAKHKGMRELYPFDADNVTKEDFLKFGEIMRPFLSPRTRGINRTDIYTDGFRDYMDSLGTHPIRFGEYSGEKDQETALRLIKDRIDSGFPVPYLTLKHTDPKYRDYTWHWFILNGYDDTEGFMVKAVTYGEGVWMDLKALWDTGFEEKGGFVTIYPADGKTEEMNK